jgi:hypothetical protein
MEVRSAAKSGTAVLMLAAAGTVWNPEKPKTCRIYVGIRSNIPPPNPSNLPAITVPEAPCS